MTSVIGSTAFDDVERGFKDEKFELLPDEIGERPEFDENNVGETSGSDGGRSARSMDGGGRATAE